jgi:hypothetical protein
MPDELCRHAFSTGVDFVSYINDPLAIAYHLGKALDDILAIPFFERYGLPDSLDGKPCAHDPFRGDENELEAMLADERCSELLTEIMGLLDSGTAPPGTACQILEDLDQLEWITLGRSYNNLALLAEIYQRYVDKGPRLNNLVYAQMYDLILYLLERERFGYRYNKNLVNYQDNDEQYRS